MSFSLSNYAITMVAVLGIGGTCPLWLGYFSKLWK